MMKWRHMQTKSSSKAASEMKSPSKEKHNGGFARSVSLPDLSRSSFASRRIVEPTYDADGEVCATGRALYNMKVKDINVNQILTRLSKFTGDNHESDDSPERIYVDESLGGQVHISRLKPDCESEGGTVSKTSNQKATSATCQLVPTDSSSDYDGRFLQSSSSSLKSDGGWRVVSTSPKPGDGSNGRQSGQTDEKRSASNGVAAGLNVSDNARTPSRSRRLPSISEDSEDTANGETVSNDDSGIEETGNGEENEQSGRSWHGRDSQSSPEDDVWATKEDGLVARFVSTLSDHERESAVLQKPTLRTEKKTSLKSYIENAPEPCAEDHGNPNSSLRPTTLFLRDVHEIRVAEYPTGKTTGKSKGPGKDQQPVSPSPVRETIPIDKEVNFDVRHCVRRVRVGTSKMPNNQGPQLRRKSDPRLPTPDEVLPTLPPAHYHGLQADKPSQQPVDSTSSKSPSMQNPREFCIKLNVAHYAPEEILVVLEGGSLVVSGERFSFSEYGCESCHFYRQYPLPEGFTKIDVSSTITDAGILVITGKKDKGRDSGTADGKTFERKPIGNEFNEVLSSVARPSRKVSVESADFQELDGQRYVLLVDCYGCPASDVSVKLEGRSLLIQTKSTLMHWEDRHGSHQSATRRYALPVNSALESVTARMMDGDVLKVEVLKLPGNGSQQYEG